MSEDNAQALVAAVARDGLPQPRLTALEQVWDALACLDAAAIEARAAQWLAELDRAQLEEEQPEPGERRERAAMRAFYASVLDYWIEQSHDVYPAVEHEIDDWLSGHAEIIAEARWQQIDALLAKAGDQSGHLVLRSWIGVEHLGGRVEIEQQTLWARIAAQVDAALGFAGALAA